MQWSKLKQRIESNFAESVKGRVEVHSTRYRWGDEEGRGWFTVDKAEVFNACTYQKRANDQGFSQADFYTALEQFLNVSIEDAVVSDNSIVQALAVIDRRVGKRQLLKKQTYFMNSEPVNALYRFRCQVENIVVKPKKVYLFDWGDTLMVDFPGVSGKMCDWDEVQAVEGAKDVLEAISADSKVYIATGAAESTPDEIQRAFERIGLAQYIDGYFCKTNVGIGKGCPEFIEAIIAQLGINGADVVMVGDSLEKDIRPALTAGARAVWFNQTGDLKAPKGIKVILLLKDLIG